MTATFRATYDTRSTSTSIHAATCPVANTKRRGFRAWDVEGTTAAEAVAFVKDAEDLDARGFTVKVCACVKKAGLR
jgi:hypothetical protein